MADMVTTDDIELLYGQTLTADEEAEVEYWIEAAIGEIEAYLGRPVTLTTFTDEEVLPSSNGIAYFKNTPVVSISALTVNGEVISDIEDWITIAPYGIDNLWEQTFQVPTIDAENLDRISHYGAEVLVTYVAGLDFPEAIRGLVLAGVLAKFSMNAANRVKIASGTVGVKRIEVEDYALEYERPLASSRSSGTSSLLVFQSETDFWSIKRYKRRSVT